MCKSAMVLHQGIAKRVINAVGKEYGGGFQKHVAKFKWEVVVVDDKVPNAFVLPGGKIVVFTGTEHCVCIRRSLLPTASSLHRMTYNPSRNTYMLVLTNQVYVCRTNQAHGEAGRLAGSCGESHNVNSAAFMCSI